MSAGLPFLALVDRTFSESTYQSLQTSYLNHFDVSPRFAKLEMPILNIFGEFDMRFPTSVTKTFKSINANVKDYEIKNAGHFPFLLEEPRFEIFRILEDVFF